MNQSVRAYLMLLAEPAVVFAAAAAMLVGGCTYSRPATPIRRADGSTRLATAGEMTILRVQERQRDEAELAESLAGCLALRPRASLKQLAISGGGSQGAWGAGYLRGWSESGARPEFDIVTGVSTGAILAVFAFLGPEYDGLLERAYTGVRRRDVLRERPTMLVPFYTSVSSSERLRARLERQIGPEVMARVAEEGERGRRLYVGTVNLDLGLFKAWDMTALARPRTEESYQRCIDVLMASMAVGVLYPPVFLDGAMHVDGGTRRYVFAVVPAADGSAGATMFVLANARPAVQARYTRNSIIDIGARSVELMSDEAFRGSLARIEMDAERAGMEFRLVLIPEDACTKPGADSIMDFDPEVMRCLYDRGVVDARSAPGGRVAR
ncbi:MAG: patatin-like phospholipase family protein [Phycisphaerales bacterium]